ncbi:class I SAM-dependent methyltransferase [Taibaiella lutea]|nr:class I SAM-dependent methyltransferase [Taibaiella lutea]
MKNNSGNFYNYMYPLYPIVDRFFKKQKKQLANIINNLPSGNVLEIGVGNGSMLPLYQKHIVTGVDLSTKMLARAKRRETQVRVHLFMADGEDMKFQKESFDYVIINHVLSVTTHPETMLQEAFRVLKPDGQLFILNHFTPGNALRFINIIFHPFAHLIQFRSYFLINDLKSLDLFRLQYMIPSKPFGYYKILAFRK